METIDVLPVKARCSFEVSANVVFDAWITDNLVRKWLFAGPTSEIISVDIDAQKGGYFSIVEFELIEKQYINHFGYYKELNKPSRILFSLEAPRQFKGETIVCVEIVGNENGCELILSQTGDSDKVPETNWHNMLQELKTIVEKK